MCFGKVVGRVGMRAGEAADVESPLGFFAAFSFWTCPFFVNLTCSFAFSRSCFFAKRCCCRTSLTVLAAASSALRATPSGVRERSKPARREGETSAREGGRIGWERTQTFEPQLLQQCVHHMS